ncbi:tetratricopeptide repeat protein [Polynucleobacter sp. UK-Kesae-W10]|uniref:tetratricopeptide repeat protein n=1 Tax=Polynucleobacter sp. UK-Kesae-W10 TaxID=1819738 RepID=UPI001C0B055B|nr:tetratricopeptide repeat protein [Polynucleobacter sp. UK-Kesae-W10]MBU3577681.1 tetratricopeptide repeat protein [Polynucleobacter sp. UK-Kesae-W10]
MNPAQIQSLFQQAVQLHQQGQLDSAEKIYEQILALAPNQFDALHLSGVVALQKKQFDKAEHLLESALRINPNHFHALNNYGNLLLESGKNQEALNAFSKAIALNPSFFQAHFNRGNTLLELEDYRAAIESFQQCLKLDPGQAEIYYSLGNAHKQLQEFDQAIQYYEQATQLQPAYVEAFNNCGLAHKELKQFTQAAECYSKALALNPQYAAAYCNQGVLQTYHTQIPEALASFDQAIAIQPNYAEAWNNKGVALNELMQLDQAIAHYQKAIDIEAQYADAHYNKGYALLLQQHFQEGLKEHEWRRQLPSYLHSAPTISKPLWLGDSPLEGKRILVFCEQGLGDTIQFSRFITPLSDLAAHVVFVVPGALLALLQAPNERVTLVDEKHLPSDVDCYCPLLSLPYSLNIRTVDIARIHPSLLIDQAKVAQWNSRLGRKKGALRVGITWSGNPTFKKDHLRSLALADFVKCLPEQNIEYISLQQVIRPRDQELVSQLSHIQFVEKEIVDFSDTAALIECLDLVVTTCTSIAHLAGSLGKPCWVLLPFAPDWKWFASSTSSPWYPSVKLFRQPELRNWDAVFANVKSELSALAIAQSRS